jgi:hypothetical protein
MSVRPHVSKRIPHWAIFVKFYTLYMYIKHYIPIRSHTMIGLYTYLRQTVFSVRYELRVSKDFIVEGRAYSIAIEFGESITVGLMHTN